MIEQINRQRVLNLLDAFYSRDLEGALARLSDDIDYIAAAPIDILPHLGHRQGKAQIREMWQIVHARYSSMRYELPFIVAEGDKVAALVRAFFRKSGNDRIVQFDIAIFFTFRDGRIDADPRGHRLLRPGSAGAGARRRRGSGRYRTREDS